METVLALLLFTGLLATMLMQLGRDARIARRLGGPGGLRSPLRRAGVVLLLLLTVPPLFVAFSGLGGVLPATPGILFAASTAIALLISYSWYRYLTWLDSFEREKPGWEFAVFVLGCGTTLLVPAFDGFMSRITGLALGQGAWRDWWFCVLHIGLVEETVKALPLLLVVFATRQAGEPIDLVIYGGISALGFAFVENTLYLADSRLLATGGRALFASVMHLFNTTIIAYAMALARHRGKPMPPAALVGLAIASCAHGFYDFWLLSPGMPGGITLVFYLATIQLWVVMKNNLVNISPNYRNDMRPPSILFRYRIINALLAIFLAAFTLRFLFGGQQAALYLLSARGTTMAATLLFLAVSLSSYRFIPGHVAPFRVPRNLLALLWPKMEWGEDLTGRRLLMRVPERRPTDPRWLAIRAQLPLEGTLAQRMVLAGSSDHYLFRPDRPIGFEGLATDALLVRPAVENDTIPGDRYVVLKVFAFRTPPPPLSGDVSPGAIESVGWVHAKLL